MIRPIYAMYDKVADSFGVPIEFESHEMAYASVRRQIRDMYFAKEITRDALEDQEFVHIADYETKTGEFENMVRDEEFCIKLLDLIGEDNA